MKPHVSHVPWELIVIIKIGITEPVVAAAINPTQGEEYWRINAEGIDIRWICYHRALSDPMERCVSLFLTVLS